MRAMSMGRQLVAVTCVALLATACTPGPEPAASPGPVVSTPAETAQEREQRLAYEAAEKSYREFRSEVNRVLRAGGAKEATPKMSRTAGGPYLRDFSTAVKSYNKIGYRDKGDEKVVYVRRGGYSSNAVLLTVCEDSRKVETVDKRGESLGRGELRTAEVEVRKVSTTWKLWSGAGEKVATCD